MSSEGTRQFGVSRPKDRESSLSREDQAIILPTLQTTNDWIVLAFAGRPRLGAIPLSVNGSVMAMTTKGKSFRKRQWWQTEDDELAAYDRKVEVWISSRHNTGISQNLLDDLEALLNSSSAKDAPHNGTEGVEDIYWAGTEAGLMGIPRFPGLIYATDGSQEKGNMGAVFYRHEGETGGFCKVGRDEEGSSSNRAEHAEACIALEDVIVYASSGRPLILLTGSKCLLMAIQRIGEGIDPFIKASPDGDILREILGLLRARIDLGLPSSSKSSHTEASSSTKWRIGGQIKVGTRRPRQDRRV